MNRVKVAVSLALLMLGLASWDAVLDHEQNVQDSAITEEGGDVKATGNDGLPFPK